jgi:hypothetical protein
VRVLISHLLAAFACVCLFLPAVHNDEFKEVSLESFKGKYVVLFFYPLDFTFVCEWRAAAQAGKAAAVAQAGGCSSNRQAGCSSVASWTSSSAGYGQQTSFYEGGGCNSASNSTTAAAAAYSHILLQLPFTFACCSAHLGSLYKCQQQWPGVVLRRAQNISLLSEVAAVAQTSHACVLSCRAHMCN